MSIDAERHKVAERYRTFARHEAAGRSPLYSRLTEDIAADPAMLDFLAELTPEKRQPNLLLGVVRMLFGLQRDYARFRAAVLENRHAVALEIGRRRTQTNEPARCAVLLPLLAQLRQPLALLEVGAAAGLCLLPDRYAYRYGAHAVGRSEVSFECEARGGVPLPATIPEIVWRAGIDLEPLELNDEDAVRWLEALVWPDEGKRAVQLERAVEIARRDPPRIVRGDLVDTLAAVAAQAPSDASLVVFHTAVLVYLEPERRAEFVRQVRQLDATWISNEGPGVTPGIDERTAAARSREQFVIARDGVAVALADSHGASIDWL